MINPKYQNNPINFVEIKVSSKIHVGRIDTMEVEHSQSGHVYGCPNNILRYVAATLIIQHSLFKLYTAIMSLEFEAGSRVIRLMILLIH